MVHYHRGEKPDQRLSVFSSLVTWHCHMSNNLAFTALTYHDRLVMNARSLLDYTSTTQHGLAYTLGGKVSSGNRHVTFVLKMFRWHLVTNRLTTEWLGRLSSNSLSKSLRDIHRSYPRKKREALTYQRYISILSCVSHVCHVSAHIYKAHRNISSRLGLFVFCFCFVFLTSKIWINNSHHFEFFSKSILYK